MDEITPRSGFDYALAAFPERDAIRIDGEALTYAALGDRVRRLASAFRARGYGPGDVVATLALNSVETVELHYVAALAPFVLNPVNHRLDAGSIARILKHGKARALIVDPVLGALAASATAKLSSPPEIVALGSDGYDRLLEDGDPAFGGGALADERATLALNYTSGSTGDPKGVLLHHRGAALQALGNAVAIRWGENARYLWIMPVFHSLAYCLPWTLPLIGGVQVCQRRFEPVGAIDIIERERITHFAAAPTIMEMLLAALGGRTVDGTPAVILAGSAPTADLIARTRAAGFRVIHAYGSTETFGAVTINLDPDPAHLHRQGVRYPTIGSFAVTGPDGGEVPRDGASPGEIRVGGPTVMTGYLDDPAATEAAMPNGLLSMGDVAVVHPDGAVEVVDRVKDVIISGGENVSSLEVEATLRRPPQVADAAVVARPDAKWGETPCAFVVLEDGAATREDELLGWARERLAGFKAPRTVVFGALPKTATGKVQKAVLRDRARALGSSVSTA